MTEKDSGGQCMRVQDRTRLWRTVRESAGQNSICRAAHSSTEQDSGGHCMRVQDRTGHAGLPIAGQNKTVQDSA
jgi:hypothetical protein